MFLFICSTMTGSMLTSDSSSRHRRRRSHRRHRLFETSKNRESNFIAAIANMIVVVLMCTALAEPQWFYMTGGGCRDHNDKPINYLGMNQFIVTGHFIQSDKILSVYNYGISHTQSKLSN